MCGRREIGKVIPACPLVGWIPVYAAIDLLRSLPYRPLSEPALAVLTGAAAAGGIHWAFASPEADPVVSRRPPSSRF